MKKYLNQFFILLFLFFTTQVYSTPIDKINFIGLNNSSEDSLLKLIPFQVGQEHTNSSSDEIIQSLFKTGLFSDITVAKNENTLDIILNENPTIKFFDINLDSGSGFSNWLKGEKLLMTKENLDEELANSLLSPGNPLTQRKLDEFILMLESKYSESGYYNVIITPNISLDSQNRAGIELSINQGDRVKIDTFRISGAEKITEENLLKLFKIGEADMAIVNYFTNKDLFTEVEFTKGIDLMTNTYFDKGYLDFKILNVDSKLDDKKEKISISINIEEGIQYQLGDVSFEGKTDIIGLGTLENAISMKKDDVFNRNLIINDIQTLTDLYADNGYAFVNINPITSEFLNVVNINFDITLN